MGSPEYADRLGGIRKHFAQDLKIWLEIVKFKQNFKIFACGAYRHQITTGGNIYEYFINFCAPCRVFQLQFHLSLCESEVYTKKFGYWIEQCFFSAAGYTQNFCVFS